MPRLILCADDFAFSHEISEAIAGLAAEGKLNAISCMAVCPGWAEDADLLATLPPAVEVGLHLVLTGERPLTAMPHLAPGGRLPSINQLARDAGRKAIALDEIAAEITAQFERFVAERGRAPDFVDGHQHCHVLPGIREIVLAETARRAPGVWVRNCEDRIGAILARPFRGKAIANALRSRGLRADAARHGLRCNDSFGGHYDFRSDYAALFPQFLRRPGDVHLVMCHPGAGDLPGDTIAAGRRRETSVLRAMPIAALLANMWRNLRPA